MVLVQKMKKCMRWLCPYGIVEIRREKIRQKDMIKDKIKENNKKAQKDTIRDYFLSLNRNEQEHEIIEIIDYFAKYNFSIFPYEFTRKYHAGDIDVFYDDSCKMRHDLFSVTFFMRQRPPLRKTLASYTLLS
jgi:hypothetical protein